MHKILEIIVATGIIIGAGITMFCGWLFLIFMGMLPWLIKVGVLAGVVYIFLKLFGML